MSDAPVFTDPMSGLPIPPLPVPRLPTPDEFLGPERLPTPDEFLGPAPTNVNELALGGADMDEYFSSGSMGEILGHFAQGARHAWGTTPLGLSPKAEKGLKDLGIFNDHEKNQFSIIREFNEGLIRPSAVAIDTVLRGVNAGVRGVSEVMVAAGVPKDLTPQAPWEAFPAGRGTGLPARIHPNLARAAEMGVIGKGEAGWRGLELETAEAARRLEPTGVERATERVITAPEPLSSARGTGLYVADVQPDIHHFARQVAPETFAEYDALAAQRETFGQRLAELGEARRNTPEAVRLQAQMDTIMTRAHGREANMTTAAQRRYNTAHFALEDMTTLDTPEMARVRQSLQDVDFRRRDLAPEVSAAYRKAQEGMPAAEAPVIEALPRPAVEAPAALAPPAVVEAPAAEMRAPAAPEAVAAAPVETPAVLPRTEAPPVVPEAAAPAPLAAAVEPVAPPIAAPAAPRAAPARVLPPGGIVEDVSRQLVAAGRPAEEAQAAAALVDAHYSARAERFAGARGTGDDLYLADAPQVRAGRNVRALEMAQRQLDQPKRGSIRLASDGARNTVTLLKDSDASTFIHETGHQWLEELVADAAHERAPLDLVADGQTVRTWLGVEDGATIPTRAHEKFARGFERYMMEGHAPSQALADVFAKFRDWLTRIYETVARLRAPINDDIRGVFDRMLAHKGEGGAVIAPERAREFTTDAPRPPRGDYTREQFNDLTAEHLSREELAREIGARDADAELAIADAERQAKEWAESRGDAWEPDADNATVVPRTLEDMENAYKQEAAAARDARESPGGPVAPGPATGDQGGLQEGVRQRGPGAGSPGRTSAGAGEAPTEPSARFGRADERLIDKAGNIRIDNLHVPDDVAQAIRDAAAEAGGFIEARRGVLSDAEVLSLADALGMGPKEIARRKVGEAFNAEEVVAARKLLIRSATDVRDAMIRAAEGTDADVVAYAEAKARHMMIQDQFSGITAEAGRALRAFRAIEGSKEAGALGEFLKENTGRTLNQMRREAQLGLKLETPQQVAKFVRDSEKPGWKDYIIEAWINALLSGPVTHVKNVIGNSAIAVNSIIETGGAAAVGAARQMIPGAATERVFFRETEARVFGLVQGSKDGIIAAGKSLLDENFTPREARTIEQRRYQAIPSVKVNVAGIDMELGGKQVRIPGRLLTAEDEFFKAIATRQEMNALAYRQALGEGLSGDALYAKVADLMQNPTDALIDQARQHAQYQTFTNPLGATGRSFQQFANSHILAKVILPFVRTPINILKYAHERTPLGLASREVRANLSGENGVVARDTQVARMALGSMVATAVAGFAAEGLITGGGPSDPKEKAALRLTGWQPYSLKIGDMYYSYAWLDPLGTIMGVTADVTHITQLGLGEGAAEYDKLGAMMVFSLSKNLLSKASLRGASDLVQALTDPDRYGPRYVQNLAGSVVPSVLGQIARSNDPLLREARDALDSIQSRIPGLRSGLMPKRDMWGEPMVNQGALGPDFGSPIAQTAVNNDPVNQALVRLHLSPAAPKREIRGVELTDQQFDDYSRIGGRLAKIRLDAVVGMPGFATLPALVQGEMISKTIDSSRELARAQVMMQSVGTQNDIMRQAVEMKVDMLSK